MGKDQFQLLTFEGGEHIGTGNVPEDFDDARHNLLPASKNRGHFELTQLQDRLQRDNSPEWTCQEIGGDLKLSLVYDLPEAMCSVR